MCRLSGLRRRGRAEAGLRATRRRRARSTRRCRRRSTRSCCGRWQRSPPIALPPLTTSCGRWTTPKPSRGRWRHGLVRADGPGRSCGRGSWRGGSCGGRHSGGRGATAAERRRLLDPPPALAHLLACVLTRTDKVAVPPVIEKTEMAAENILHDAGFEVLPQTVENCSDPQTVVDERSPGRDAGRQGLDGDDSRQPGTEGAGPRRVRPSGRQGREGAERQEPLPKQRDAHSDSVAGGRVVRTEPAAGTDVDCHQGDDAGLTRGEDGAGARRRGPRLHGCEVGARGPRVHRQRGQQGRRRARGRGNRAAAGPRHRVGTGQGRDDRRLHRRGGGARSGRHRAAQ